MLDNPAAGITAPWNKELILLRSHCQKTGNLDGLWSRRDMGRSIIHPRLFFNTELLPSASALFIKTY